MARGVFSRDVWPWCSLAHPAGSCYITWIWTCLCRTYPWPLCLCSEPWHEDDSSVSTGALLRLVFARLDALRTLLASRLSSRLCVLCSAFHQHLGSYSYSTPILYLSEFIQQLLSLTSCRSPVWHGRCGYPEAARAAASPVPCGRHTAVGARVRRRVLFPERPLLARHFPRRALYRSADRVSRVRRRLTSRSPLDSRLDHFEVVCEWLCARLL